MEVVINSCFGGFGLSPKAVMRFAELSGFQLFAVQDQRKEDGSLDFSKFEPYNEEKNPFVIHYLTKPLLEDGDYEPDSYWNERSIQRNDPILVQVVRELGEAANGKCAELKIVEIPDDVAFEIEEYDGVESIHEVHGSWT